MQRLIGQMDELTKAGRLPIAPDTEIERMSVLLDVDEDHIEHFLHGRLDERIGTLPEDARAAFAYEVACRDEAVCGRIAVYWLLDDSAEVRLGAAEGFRERALREIVEPVSAALAPLIRNWMPADAGRTLLDEALAEARRRELVAPPPAGLIDVALSCRMQELRPRAMSAGERLSELDPDDGIAALQEPVREGAGRGQCGVAGRLPRGEGLVGRNGDLAAGDGGVR